MDYRWIFGFAVTLFLVLVLSPIYFYYRNLDDKTEFCKKNGYITVDNRCFQCYCVGNNLSERIIHQGSTGNFYFK